MLRQFLHRQFFRLSVIIPAQIACNHIQIICSLPIVLVLMERAEEPGKGFLGQVFCETGVLDM